MGRSGNWYNTSYGDDFVKSSDVQQGKDHKPVDLRVSTIILGLGNSKNDWISCNKAEFIKR